jgi:alpha-beta hydrolase superfamily lysophospholipase
MAARTGSLTASDGVALFTHAWTIANPKALVVLTHGFGEHGARYGGLGRTLTKAGYALYAYDVRGHGRSQGRRGHIPSYAALLDDLSRLVANARAEHPEAPLFLFGHSMGGNIAISYALRRSEGLSGVLVTAPLLRLGFIPPFWKVAIARIFARLVPGLTLATGLDQNNLSHDPVVVESIRADPLAHGRMSARTFVSLMDAADYALLNAPRLRVPILLLHGDDDRLTDIAGTEAFHASVEGPDKQFISFPGMYHEILNEVDAAAVHATIVEWLDRRTYPGSNTTSALPRAPKSAVT